MTQLLPVDNPVGKGSNTSIHKAGSRWGEGLIKFWLQICALLSILTTLAVVVLLMVESFEFFTNVSPVEFFFGTR